MTDTANKPKTGYFNALASSSFKVTADGRKLFFPWGVLGGGYDIPSEQDYERLQRQIKVYTIAAMVLVIAPIAIRYFLTGFVIAALLMLFYVLWVPYLVRGLKRTDERLTMRETVSTQARTHNAPTLWLMQFASLAFVAIGIVMLIVEPGMWPVALMSIVFFGFCAMVFAWMLVARGRATQDASNGTA